MRGIRLRGLLATGVLAVLVVTTEGNEPAISPDGKMLAFVRYDAREKNDRYAVFEEQHVVKIS